MRNEKWEMRNEKWEMRNRNLLQAGGEGAVNLPPPSVCSVRKHLICQEEMAQKEKGQRAEKVFPLFEREK